MAAKSEGKNVSSRNVKVLAIVVLVLFAGLFALNTTDRSESPAGGNLVFPELKSRLNDINTVTITDADGEITLRRETDAPDGRWIAPDFGGYPVDTGSLRQLLLAIADARKLEQKTSDPELYGRLGVEDPRETDGSGVLVSARGDNAAVALILGDTAQSEFRYARIPEEAPSWLISENPTLPAERAGWLLPEIVDIDTSRIESAVIRHADGDVIVLRKANAGDPNFEVEDIPEGRELRYPSVANGIAAVVSSLNLEDVRRTAPKDGSAEGAREDAAITAEFRTFDGLELLLRVYGRSAATPDAETEEANAETGDDSDNDRDDDEQYWIALTATASPPPAGEEAQPSPEEADASPDPDAGEAGEAGEAGVETPADPADEAADINDRVSGWTYRIASYKADQLMRRWEDLLSDPEDGETN
jgi:hypothetical protein